MEKIICGHQPNFLPYPGYFHKMMNCDHFIFVDNVEFVGKGTFGWIHRNKIRIHNKDEHWLTVPVLTKDRFHQDIIDVEIVNDAPWRKKHWKSIYYNYKDTQYFDKYADELKNIYDKKWEKLINLNLRLLEFFMKALDIETPTCRSSKEGITGEATELIINLCKAFDGDTYLSGIHGREYLDRDRIKHSSVKIIFQEFDPLEYPQPYDEFVPYLSTLDLLFNCGPESRKIIQNSGTLSRSWESPS